MKNILKVLCMLGIFFYMAYLTNPIVLSVFNIDLTTEYIKAVVLADIFCSLCITIFAVIVYGDVLIDGIKKIYKSIKESKFGDFLGTVIVSYILCIIINLIAVNIENVIAYILGVSLETSENQNLIESVLGYKPWIMVISACVLAPIAEELLFRGGIKKVVKNKRVFIAVSGLIFGLVHVTDSLVLVIEILLIGILLSNILENPRYSNFNKIKLSVIVIVYILVIFGGIYHAMYVKEYGSLLNLISKLSSSEMISSISYIAMGSMLAYIYQKEDNIMHSIGVHFMNNTLAMISILFL